MQIKTLGVTIKKFYTDVDGNLIVKSTIPANLQQKVPYYLFGQFDKDSNYALGRRTVPTIPSMFYYNMYISNSYDFLLMTGANGIRGQIGVNDIAFCYTDNVINPNYFIWMVVSGIAQPIASVFSNLDGSMRTNYFNFLAQNVEPYDEDLFYVTTDKLGNFNRQSINPRAFYGSGQPQKELVRIDLQIVLTKYFGLYSYMPFNDDEINLSFIIAAEQFDTNNKSDFKINK